MEPLLLMNALEHRDIALMLLFCGADVNRRTKAGSTAVQYAAARHVTGMIKLLVDKGADINTQDDEGLTLMCASGAWDSVDDRRLYRQSSTTEPTSTGAIVKAGPRSCMPHRKIYPVLCAC